MSFPTGFQPMLAATITEEQLDQLRYPVIVQPKLDGIRCIVKDGAAYSRKLKLIPNRYIQKRLADLRLADLFFDSTVYDGELVLMDHKATFQEITSAVMTENGEPDFLYKIFDRVSNDSYKTRLSLNSLSISDFNYETEHIYSVEVQTKEELAVFETEIVDAGYEGIIIRSPNSPYKFGRSTLREQYLLKLKRFCDAEAEVIGVEPKYHNANPLEYDERGYAKHSAHQDNLIPLPMLGALKVRGINGEFKGVEFNVGSGFTDYDRTMLWKRFIENKEKLMPTMHPIIGQIITYKYQKCGSKDKPRCPVFKAFRKDI